MQLLQLTLLLVLIESLTKSQSLSPDWPELAFKEPNRVQT